jgi:lipopolysaccharide transport system permease protein
VSDETLFNLPKEMAAVFWRNRSLIYTLTRREVVGRYRGSIMGITWSFFILCYADHLHICVFCRIEARWGIAAQESKIDFAIMLFIGMIIHGLFADCVNGLRGLSFPMSTT